MAFIHASIFPCCVSWGGRGFISPSVSGLTFRECLLQDNVFVSVVCSIQYRVVRQNADDAFYELQNPKEQIQSYVFDGWYSEFHSNIRYLWLNIMLNHNFYQYEL